MSYIYSNGYFATTNEDKALIYLFTNYIQEVDVCGPSSYYDGEKWNISEYTLKLLLNKRNSEHYMEVFDNDCDMNCNHVYTLRIKNNKLNRVSDDSVVYKRWLEALSN